MKTNESTILNLHPDDVLFFNDVRDAMKTVAKQYQLPLRSITPLAMPQAGMADRMGQCSYSGDIQIVLRCTVDGQFVDDPMSPTEVWDTAAHELAHLRHMNHGVAFQEFRLELVQALQNKVGDHREKVLARLVKMQAARDGEAALGNGAAAEAFASAINRMLIEHELNPSDVDYARAADKDPVIELRVNLGAYKIDEKKVRIAWQESLARVVAKSHLCTFLLRSGSNQIWFVGTKSHATVAEYAYGTLLPAAVKMCEEAYHQYGLEGAQQLKADAEAAGKGVDFKKTWTAREPGFKESWLTAFIQRIAERFDEARQAAVAEAPEGASVALVRLDGALVKVKTYIDDKFKKRRGASPLSGLTANHSVGVARGRAAANAMTIGRRGVTTSTTRQLK